MSNRLTKRQQIFVKEYLIDLNATQAAIRAGYSEKGAQVHSSKLLSNAIVSQAIEEGMKKRAEKVDVRAEDILKELLMLAKVDLAKAYDQDGNLKNIHDIPEETRRAIAGIEVDELFEGYGKDRQKIGLTKKVKFYDKNRALELLGKHLAMWVDKIESRNENKNLEVTVDFSWGESALQHKVPDSDGSSGKT